MVNSVDGIEDIDDVYTEYPQDHLDDKTNFHFLKEHLDLLSSDELKFLNEHILNECDERNYDLGQALLAKSDLIPFEYNHLKALAEEVRRNPSDDSISHVMTELNQQLKITKEDIKEAEQFLSKAPDYNLAQQVLDLFLQKEQNINQTIQGVGKNLNSYNQLTKSLNQLKDLYINKSKVMKKDSTPEQQKELKKIDEEIEKLTQKLNGEKIVASRWFPGITMETKIEFPDVDNDTPDGITEIKEYISNTIKEIKSRINEGFASLQEFFQTLMQCFKCIQNAIRHYEETFSRIVRNFKTNG